MESRHDTNRQRRAWQAPKDVVLAPRIDLHTGYHGAICAFPPEGVRIEPKDAHHLFVFDAEISSPYEEAHLGEFIEVDGAPRVVHTARWPVLGSSAWVADTDDLMYPMLCGRTAMSSRFRASVRDSGNAELVRRMKERVENMATAYLHPSCIGVLFRGNPKVGREVMTHWLDYLGISSLGDKLLSKVTMVRPAQRSADASFVRAKWNSCSPVRVLFCGRDFDVKNGLLALQVMARVRAKVPTVVFVYIGDVSPEVIAQHPELMEGVIHHEQMDHAASLQAMLEAHVLFHPSKMESIGIVLLEAMGAAVAVVTARGESMGYSDELFATGGALLIDRELVAEADEAGIFEKLVLEVVTNPSLAAELAMRNYALTTSGDYSILAQNRALAKAYDLASDRRGDPLSLADLPHVSGKNVLRISSAEVKVDERAFRRRHDIGAGYKSVLV